MGHNVNAVVLGTRTERRARCACAPLNRDTTYLRNRNTCTWASYVSVTAAGCVSGDLRPTTTTTVTAYHPQLMIFLWEIYFIKFSPSVYEIWVNINRLQCICIILYLYEYTNKKRKKLRKKQMIIEKIKIQNRYRLAGCCYHAARPVHGVQ